MKLLFLIAIVLHQSVAKKDWPIKNIRNCTQNGLKFITKPLDPESGGFPFRCDQFRDQLTGKTIGYLDPEENEVVFGSTFDAPNLDILTEHGYRYACYYYQDNRHEEIVAIKCIFAFNETFQIVTDAESEIIEEYNMKCDCQGDEKISMTCQPYES